MTDANLEWAMSLNADEDDEVGDAPKKPNVGGLLLNLARKSGAKVFLDSGSGEYYIAPNADGTQVWRLNSTESERWLTRLWLQSQDNPAPRDLIKTALFNLGALAEDAESIALNVRVAWKDGLLWYDLGKEAVCMSPEGSAIVESPPILFKRFPHQMDQITPGFPGDFNLIDKYLPVEPGSTESLLLKVWLLSCLSPDGPRAIMDLAGPEGSGKSTTSRVMKRVLDPSLVPTIRRLKDLRALQQHLAQTWALFADNLDGIGGETSDLLAAAVTGDADFRRKLYTDQEAQIFQYRRVLCLSGIAHTAERPDLLDRVLLVTLSRINERQDEATFWDEFDSDLPRIIGGAFELLSKAVGILPDVSIPRRFRMADFAKWGYAIAEASGWGGNKFLAAYEQNIGRQKDEAVSASLVAQAVLAFMDDRTEWEGTPTSLKELLDGIARDSFGIEPTDRRSGWPQDAPRMSKELFKMGATLAANQIEVSQPTRGGTRGRLIRLRVIPETTDTTDTTDTSGVETGVGNGLSASATDTTDAKNQAQSVSSVSSVGKVVTSGGRRLTI
ncbi:MAG: hypothetical protein O2913_00925 [Chloroflexi bacterium]|nr:hypothetical protein [Chloroflexota bacterium]